MNLHESPILESARTVVMAAGLPPITGGVMDPVASRAAQGLAALSIALRVTVIEEDHRVRILPLDWGIVRCLSALIP